MTTPYAPEAHSDRPDAQPQNPSEPGPIGDGDPHAKPGHQQGGRLHTGGCPVMTTGSGIEVFDNQNSQTAGERGPLLMQDFRLLEKMAHFNRERVPERVVHAKGAGAFGTFTVTGDISRYTCAGFLQPGQQVEMLARFSTVAGETGYADTVRDPRGFALKFYTPEGNWDMVGNNTPVFFARDPSKFQDFIHSQKRQPQTGLRDKTMQWDYWSLSPESLHQVTILMSDRGIPATYRHMHGFSSHTFSLWNDAGERYWVKWHFLTQQGIKNLSDDEAGKIAGLNPDYHRQDLFSAINRGEFPRWTAYIQAMPEADAETYHTNPFDLTKVWSHADYPLVEVGVMELNKNPDNYFAQIESAAFDVSNVPRGLGFSPDKMLQARIMSYADAHRYRIGVNYTDIAVNRPKCPVHSYLRDGHMPVGLNHGDNVNYEPNSFGGPVEGGRARREPPLKVSGNADAYDQRHIDDHYQQPGDLFRLMTEEKQKILIDNIVGHMKDVPEFIQQRQIAHFTKADPAFGEGVAKGLGLTAEAHLKPDAVVARIKEEIAAA